MSRARLSIIGVTALSLAACATTPQEKRPLTEPVAKQILSACGANPGSFERFKGMPPSIKITIPAAEQAASGVAPTMTCVHDRLKSYRYGMIIIANSNAEGE